MAVYVIPFFCSAIPALLHTDNPVPAGLFYWFGNNPQESKMALLKSIAKRRRNKHFHQDRIAMRIADRYGMTYDYKVARCHRLTPSKPSKIGTC